LARVLLADSLQGANWPGSEKAVNLDSQYVDAVHTFLERYVAGAAGVPVQVIQKYRDIQYTPYGNIQKAKKNKHVRNHIMAIYFGPTAVCFSKARDEWLCLLYRS